MSTPDLFDPPDGATLSWVNLILTAQWLGVAPWELAKQPAAWFDAIQLAMEAQNVRGQNADSSR